MAEANGSKKKAESTLSDKIEESVEGLFRFGLRYLRTIAFFTLFPCRVARVVVEQTHYPGGNLIRPLSYFTVAGFVFSLLVGTMGGVKAVNIFVSAVFVTEEFAETVIQEIRGGISVTDMVLGGLPAILAVVLGTHFVAWLCFRNPLRNKIFATAALYSFGTQLALFMMAIGVSTLDQLEMAHDVLGLSDLLASAPVRGFVFLLFYGLLMLSVLTPLMVTQCVLTPLIRRQSWCRLVLTRFAAVALAFVLPAICFYLVSIPPRLDNALAASQDANEDAYLTLPLDAEVSDVSGNRFTLRLTLVFHNPSGEAVLLGRDDVYVEASDLVLVAEAWNENPALRPVEVVSSMLMIHDPSGVMKIDAGDVGVLVCQVKCETDASDRLGNPEQSDLDEPLSYGDMWLDVSISPSYHGPDTEGVGNVDLQQAIRESGSG